MVIVLPVYAAGEKGIKKINAKSLALGIQKNSCTNTYSFNHFGRVKDFLNKEIKEGETVVFMGAGNISELAYDYVNELSKANV
jgi:UDP-N-acetylmuramate-alanine ligase